MKICTLDDAKELEL